MTALNIRISKGLASGKKSFGEIIKLKPNRRSSGNKTLTAENAETAKKKIK
jgi:hypothetical protein